MTFRFAFRWLEGVFREFSQLITRNKWGFASKKLFNLVTKRLPPSACTSEYLLSGRLKVRIIFSLRPRPLSFEHHKLGWRFSQDITRKKQDFTSEKLLKLVYKAFIDVSLYTVQGTCKVWIHLLYEEKQETKTSVSVKLTKTRTVTLSDCREEIIFWVRWRIRMLFKVTWDSSFVRHALVSKIPNNFCLFSSWYIDGRLSKSSWLFQITCSISAKLNIRLHVKARHKPCQDRSQSARPNFANLIVDW